MRNHPLCPRVGVWLGDSMGFNWIDGKAATKVGTNFSDTVGDLGRFSATSSTGSYWNAGDYSAKFNGGGGTLLVLVRGGATGTVASNTFVKCTTDTLLDEYPYFLSGTIYTGIFSNGRWASGAAPVKDINSTHWVVVQAETNNFRLSQDGITVATAGSATFTAPTDLSLVGSSAGGCFTRGAYFIGVDNRRWTDAEVSAFVSDPWQIFRAPSSNILAYTTDVTSALTGQAITSAAGTLAPQISTALTGQAATSAAGTLVPTATLTLSGSELAGALGTLTPDIAQLLSGLGLTLSLGTLTAVGGDVTAALTGISATMSIGDLLASLQSALTGQAVTGEQGTFTPVLSTSITGQSATSAQGTLTNTVSPALTGQATTSAQGSLGPVIQTLLSGAASTAAAGALSPAFSIVLSGDTVTAASGTLTPVVTQLAQLTGLAIGVSQGSLATGLSTALLGEVATAATGALTASVIKALTGTSATLDLGMVAPAIAPVLSGAGLTFAQGNFGISLSVNLAGVAATAYLGTLKWDTESVEWILVEDGTNKILASSLNAGVIIAQSPTIVSVGAASDKVLN